jgi:hypothetical protein
MKPKYNLKLKKKEMVQSKQNRQKTLNLGLYRIKLLEVCEIFIDFVNI